ncbi:MAG: hypothetical protein HYR58_04055 [Acidobacteria bacterium]|nr:hypothetical protein [Acidobacteriota bacterium]
MQTIRTLRPNVTRAEAVAGFQRGWGGFLRRARWGALRSISEVYVPFRLYRVEIVNDTIPRISWFALDAVNGSLDLYQFEHKPGETELMRVETRNRPQARALRLLQDRIRRLIFQTGFFRVRNLQIRAELIPLDLHVPYWIGFYGRGETPRLRVMDAVRRCFEGAKARAFFESWLAS